MKALKNNLRLSLLTTFLAVPSFASAALPAGFPGLKALIDSLATGVVQSLGYMLLTLAVVAFFFGVVQFIWSARQGAEGKGIQKGKQFLVWGLVGIFVMFSVWGIIQFAQGVLGIQTYNTITVPSLNFNRDGASSGPSPTSSGLNPTGSNPTGSNPNGGAATIPAASCAGYISNGSCYSDACQNGCPVSGSTPTASQLAAQQATQAQISAINQASAQIAAAGGNGNQIGTTPADCVSRGGSESACAAAFPAPVTGSVSGDNAFDNCIAAGGGVGECRNIAGSSGGNQDVGGAYGPDNVDVGGGWNPGSSETGGDWGPSADYGYEDWQTAGDGTPGDWGTPIDYGSNDWETANDNGFGFDIQPSGDITCSCDFWVEE